MDSRAIGLIHATSPSSWASCRKILKNLVNCYRLAFGDGLANLHYDSKSDAYAELKLARQIKDAQLKTVAFVDHSRHPRDLLFAMDIAFGKAPWPELVFHVYGDFTLLTPQWQEVEDLLMKKRVKFICASPAQYQLLLAMLSEDSKACLSQFPFLVDRHDFYHSPEKRDQFRQRRGICANEKVIFYSGRLSMQKNIFAMLDAIRTYLNELSPCKILLAGEFDDLGSPFFSVQPQPGLFARELEKWLAIHLELDVKLLGSLSTPELNEAYNGADLLMSLSTHHDEDFGMAPAEALCAGLPALLSSWGGYRAFEQRPYCELLPVKVGIKGPTLNAESFLLLTKSILTNVTEDFQRSEIAEFYRQRLCVDSKSADLAKIILEDAEEFHGFSNLLRVHAQRVRSHPSGQGLYAGEEDSLYKKIYESYAPRDILQNSEVTA